MSRRPRRHKMLSIQDIDKMFAETKDGTNYLDLHQSVHGFRPEQPTFSSMDEFESKFADLANKDFIIRFNNMCGLT